MIKRDWTLLFWDHDLRAVLDAQRAQVRDNVRSIPESEFGRQSDEYLSAVIASQLVVAPPELHEDRIAVSKRDAPIDVSHDFNRVHNPFGPTIVDGLEVTYHLPFSGDVNLFRCKPSTWTSVIPRAIIAGTELQFPYDAPDRSVEATHRYFQDDISGLKKWLGWVTEQVSSFNRELEPATRREVAKRRTELDRDRASIAALGYAVRGSLKSGPEALIQNPREVQQAREAKRAKARRKFDVALSFAGEDREYVEAVATALRGLGLTVFYDRFEQVDLWGKDLADHLGRIYGEDSRYVVLFASRHYASKGWPNHEKSFALARHLKGITGRILPVRFDATEIPGLPPTIGYVDVRAIGPEQLAELVRQKIDEPTDA